MLGAKETVFQSIFNIATFPDNQCLFERGYKWHVIKHLKHARTASKNMYEGQTTYQNEKNTALTIYPTF